MSKEISRVNRSKEQAKKYYDRISGIYDWLGGIFERRPAEKALNYLKIQSGETVLEMGFGTGHCLQLIATSVGSNGKAFGTDISEGMIKRTRERLNNASLLDRVELHHGDAIQLPFNNETFNAAFMSFTLELFDNPEIPMVLSEVKRVLKPGGRLGIVSLSKTNSIAVNSYEWIHNKWPKYVDCRPIYLSEEIQKAGYSVLLRKTASLVILPIETVIAIKDH